MTDLSDPTNLVDLNRKLNEHVDRVAFATAAMRRLIIELPLSQEGQDLGMKALREVFQFQCTLSDIRHLTDHEVA